MNKQEILEVFNEFLSAIEPLSYSPFVKDPVRLARFMNALIALAEKLPDEPSGGNQAVYWKNPGFPGTPEYDDH